MIKDMIQDRTSRVFFEVDPAEFPTLNPKHLYKEASCDRAAFRAASWARKDVMSKPLSTYAPPSTLTDPRSTGRPSRPRLLDVAGLKGTKRA